MPDIQLNRQSITASGTAGTTAPSSGTSEVWTVTALSSGIPALSTNQTYALMNANGISTEIIRVTACDGSGDTSITVTRGADSTTPVAHSSGSTFNIVVVQSYFNTQAADAPSYAPEILSNGYSNERGIYNYKSSNTRILDQGVSDVMAGGISHHLVIGDSVSAGATSGVVVTTYDRLHAWPLMFRDQLAATGVPANGTGTIRLNDNAQNDARISGVSGFTNTSSWGFIATVVNSTFTVTLDRGGSVLDVLYYNGAACTFTVSIDGASSGVNFATVTTTATNVPAKYRMSGTLAKKGSTVTVKLTVAGSGVIIYGLSCWSPNGGLVIHNVAQSGSKAGGTGNSSWTDMSNGPLAVYKDIAAGRKRTITDAATTASSTTLTSATAAFTTNDQGDPVYMFPDTSGPLFPPNTYMVARLSATTMQMSNAALITASGKTLQLGSDPDCVHICLGGNDVMQDHATPATIAANITTIRNYFPNSDCILHLENEPSPTLASASEELAFQKGMYQLADTLDVPLYDWRDRAGSYTTAFNNGVMQDYQAHMTPGMYADLGASLAWIIGGGSAHAQSYTDPVFEGDLIPKYWADGLSRFKSALTASGSATSGTTEQIVYQFWVPPNTFKAGTTFRINLTGTITGTSPTILARLRIGTAGTTSDTAIGATGASSAIASGAGWQIDVETTCRTIGSSGTFVTQARVLADAISPKLSAPASVTINTTVGLWVSVSVTPGGTTPVLTPFQGFVETSQN